MEVISMKINLLIFPFILLLLSGCGSNQRNLSISGNTLNKDNQTTPSFDISKQREPDFVDIPSTDSLIANGEFANEWHQERLQKIVSQETVRSVFKKDEPGPFAVFENDFVRIKVKLDDLIPSIVYSARKNGFQITSCAETFDLVRFGVEPGKCVDDLYIQQVFGIEVNHKKDPSQREACGCVASKDIGMYNSCTFGCRYCYANSNFELSSNNFRAHDPEAPSLLGWIDYPET